MPEIKDITQEIVKSARTGAVNTARDAMYVTVGLGVLAVQRAQVQRQELRKALVEPRGQLESRLTGVRDEITRVAKGVDDRVERVIGAVEASLEPLEGRLPEQARDIVKQAHAQARGVRRQIRDILVTAAA